MVTVFTPASSLACKHASFANYHKTQSTAETEGNIVLKIFSQKPKFFKRKRITNGNVGVTKVIRINPVGSFVAILREGAEIQYICMD